MYIIKICKSSGGETCFSETFPFFEAAYQKAASLARENGVSFVELREFRLDLKSFIWSDLEPFVFYPIASQKEADEHLPRLLTNVPDRRVVLVLTSNDFIDLHKNYCPDCAKRNLMAYYGGICPTCDNNKILSFIHEVLPCLPGEET